MAQIILTAQDNYAGLSAWLAQNGLRNVLLVCDDSIRFLTGISRKLEELEGEGLSILRFSDFQPNPAYASVTAGVALFRAKGCDGILAIGGGSAMDVAK